MASSLLTPAPRASRGGSRVAEGSAREGLGTPDSEDGGRLRRFDLDEPPVDLPHLRVDLVGLLEVLHRRHRVPSLTRPLTLTRRPTRFRERPLHDGPGKVRPLSYEAP